MIDQQLPDWNKLSKETGSVMAEFGASPGFRDAVRRAVIAGTAQAIVHDPTFKALVKDIMAEVSKDPAFRTEVVRKAAAAVASAIEDKLSRAYDY